MIAAPCRELTKTSSTWRWGKEEEEAFVSLKEKPTNSELIAYFNKDADTEVIVDASPVGLGAILSQRQSNG